MYMPESSNADTNMAALAEEAMRRLKPPFDEAPSTGFRSDQALTPLLTGKPSQEPSNRASHHYSFGRSPKRSYQSFNANDDYAIPPTPVSTPTEFVFKARIKVDAETSNTQQRMMESRLNALERQLDEWQKYVMELRSRMVGYEASHNQLKDWTICTLARANFSLHERDLKRSKN
jgi:hypothetical protein